MAEIDKSLPNQPEDLAPEDTVEVVEEQTTPASDEVEVVETDDGGVEVSFDPTATDIPEMGHFSNLAEALDDDVLDPIGAQLTSDYLDYRSSRKDWEDTYKNGLDLLGFKYEKRTEPFRGASGVKSRHSVSSTSLQRTFTCRWTCQNTSFRKNRYCKRRSS
jgi:hypothetical protein